MSNTILVTYATRYGSTKEVAETIADTLRNVGHSVDVRATQDVNSVDGYRAVVLGAPLYISKWPKAVHNLLEQHRNTLMQRPVAVFALGPISTDAAEMQGSRGQLDKELAQYDWLQPVAVELFVGAYDPRKLSFGHKLLAALPASPLHGLQTSDNRDWDAIRTWARSLAPTLQGRPTS